MPFFPGGLEVNNPPTVQKIRVHSLGREDAWWRKWQTSPLFLPGKFYGQNESPWGSQESDATESTGMDIFL